MAARVLIIEDNQANMDLLVYLLDAVGHQPLSAFDGEQGVALAHSERPDLIVCDLHLPKLDGHGVLQALRGHPVTRGIPVIAASALPVNDNGAALRRAGFTGCVPKSLEPDVLVPALEAYLPPALRIGHLPAGHEEIVAAPVTPAGGHAAIHVLLLDAAPEYAGLSRSLLSHFGYRLTLVSEAAQIAACTVEHFDLLLCDIGLPDASRQALVAQALHSFPQLPAILIRPDDAVTPLPSRSRPIQLLCHPLEPAQLAAAIDAQLAAAQPEASDMMDISSS
ncbi:response regulator [Massilia sp. NR 4-1]|uniref:response regulator n=1 Tax=Massilia sp. NR 4-1 TaxID=1678028 RepID=UPI00067C2C54|nr:response regulator [Massilia sp. NR 4-1]